VKSYRVLLVVKDKQKMMKSYRVLLVVEYEQKIETA